MGYNEFNDEEEATLAVAGSGKARPRKASHAYLIVLAGSNTGEMHRLGHQAILGRGAEAEVRIFDTSVSREHALFVYRDEQVAVEDLGSRNGTFINGAPVRQRTPLRDGDQIQIGSTTILKFSHHDHLEERFQQQMYELALRDGLTKLYNRKFFMDRLKPECAFRTRHAGPLALIMLDVDRFKKVNDTFGHQAGDFVLVKLARSVEPVLRAEDTLARYGGEEFVVLCRDTAEEAALALAERIRERIARSRFQFEGRLIPTTISLGVACVAGSSGEQSPEALLSAADTALYAAKNNGRNRVESVRL